MEYLKEEISLDERRPGHIAKKWTCPSCQQKKRYVRYYNFTTGEYLPEEYGRCDRENNCGYFNKPDADFFKTGEIRPYEAPSLKQKKQPLPTSFIDSKLFLGSLKAYDNNVFAQFLINAFGEDWAYKLLEKYLVGTSRWRPGANVFWQIDTGGKVRTGKIMLYQVNGRRDKDACVNWVHTVLKLDGFNLRQCFFGEHLLKDAKSGSTIAIVESEKTAIVASYFFREYIWLATGGKDMLSLSKAKVLHNHKVVLFPDLEESARQKWESLAADMHEKFGIKAIVSDYMEHINDGSDIADILLDHPIDKYFGNILNEMAYPADWDE